jgi:Protein of unknown function (DUF3168)
MSHLSQLHTALHATLHTDAALNALISGVYDSAPENALFPYITLSEMRVEDASSRGISISTITIALNIWSRYQGRRELYDISARLDSLMTTAHLVGQGATMLVHIRKESQRFMQLEAQRIMQSHLQYQAVMQGTL